MEFSRLVSLREKSHGEWRRAAVRRWERAPGFIPWSIP